jgi:predicted nucleic acid-binding protein
MVYWDTSCVVKLYTQENDSGFWEKHALESDDQFVSSALMRTEMAFALEQKEARGDICSGAADELLKHLDYDIGKGRFTLIPIGSDVLSQSCGIARKCYHAKPSIFIRTLDGIHLATAKLLKCRQIAGADARMNVAADFMGFELLSDL